MCFFWVPLYSLILCLVLGHKLQKDQCCNGDETNKQRVLLGTCRGMPELSFNWMFDTIYLQKSAVELSEVCSPVASHCVSVKRK